MRRRMLASVVGKPLPYDAEVEWLQSDGNAFIDTGVFLNSESSVRARFVDIADGKSSCYFGSRVSANARNIGAGRGNGTMYPSCYVDFNDYSYSSTRLASSGITIFDSEIEIFTSKSLREIRCAGRVVQNNTSVSQVFECTTPLYVFKMSGNPPSDVRLASNARFLSFSVDGVLDMTPVRFTNENGEREGAMYDRVSGKLFRNAGTGAFIIGPDK